MLRQNTTLLMLSVLIWPNIALCQDSKQLNELRVLYVGAERSREYIEFLQGHVRLVESIDRVRFNPESATGFDVVLLDWPSANDLRSFRDLRSPLGSRDQWARPTVLLGSAGLNLAVAWKVQGGSGCTCMEPLAYGLRSHEIFDSPGRIGDDGFVHIKTPEAFSDIESEVIDVLPLVEDRGRTWAPGRCTYSQLFEKCPDIEFFCGGVNQKSSSAAGLWRQGNLLHFGFAQSPTEMNEVGRQLLLNSIAYISRFTQDRPIAITPSVFAGPVPPSRETPARWLARDYLEVSAVLELFEPTAKAMLVSLRSRPEQIAWCKRHEAYLYPAKDHLLGVDEDLKAVGVPFDSQSFFGRVIGGLDAIDIVSATRSKRLLDRYVPCGPGRDASSAEWKEWYASNKPYLFALDAGEYRWYVDPLAKSRGVPSRQLRGPLRADIQ